MRKNIVGDFHLHSDFSGDSQAPMKDMIEKGIRQGLKIMCFTEHLDKDYPKIPGEDIDFNLDTDSYYRRFEILKKAYESQIGLRFGVELGLQPHLSDFHRNYIQSYPFDFIIGSSHVTHGQDPYYPCFYEGRSEDEAYREYFESILENLQAFCDVDVYGHIDYVVRYGPNQNQFYTYHKFADILDEILRTIIHKGLGIECNTGGIKYGLGHPNPCEEILIRYRELGGEILTIGSDAHKPEHIAYSFDILPEMLRSCGFRYYTVFKERKPEFLPL